MLTVPVVKGKNLFYSYQERTFSYIFLSPYLHALAAMRNFFLIINVIMSLRVVVVPINEVQKKIILKKWEQFLHK